MMVPISFDRSSSRLRHPTVGLDPRQQSVHPLDHRAHLLETLASLVSRLLARPGGLVGVRRDPIDLLREGLDGRGRACDGLGLVARPRGHPLVELLERRCVTSDLGRGLPQPLEHGRQLRPELRETDVALARDGRAVRRGQEQARRPLGLREIELDPPGPFELVAQLHDLRVEPAVALGLGHGRFIRVSSRVARQRGEAFRGRPQCPAFGHPGGGRAGDRGGHESGDGAGDGAKSKGSAGSRYPPGQTDAGPDHDPATLRRHRQTLDPLFRTVTHRGRRPPGPGRSLKPVPALH